MLGLELSADKTAALNRQNADFTLGAIFMVAPFAVNSLCNWGGTLLITKSRL